MKEVGRKIKALREAKGVTLKIMGDIFKVGITTYSARETRGDFSEDDMTKILKKLGISRDEFQAYRIPGEEIKLSLPETLMGMDAKLDVLLSAIGELLAKQNGQSVTGAVNDLTKAVKERYDLKIGELLRSGQ